MLWPCKNFGWFHTQTETCFVFHVSTCKPVIHTQRLTCLFQIKPNLVNINIKTKKTESQTVMFTVLNEKIKFHQTLCANKTINRIENLTSRITGRLAPSLGEVTVWSHSVSRSKNQPLYTACLSTSGEHSPSRQVGRGARRVCSNGSQTYTKPETTDVGKHLSHSSFTVILTCGDISRRAVEMHLGRYKESTAEPMRKDEWISYIMPLNWGLGIWTLNIYENICEWRYSKYNKGRQRQHSKQRQECRIMKIKYMRNSFD